MRTSIRRRLAGFAVLWLALTSGALACDKSARIEGAGERYFLLAEGDSITFGIGSTDGLASYVPRACVPKVNGIETIITAVPGAVLGSRSDSTSANSLYARMDADNAILARKGKRVAILSILIGRNDLAKHPGGPQAYADDLAAYIKTMRDAGWDRVIVATILPSNYDRFTLLRHRLNAILGAPGWAKAHGVDAIADFAKEQTVGPDKAAADPKLFGDGTHPTNAGYAALAPVYDKALKDVMTR